MKTEEAIDKIFDAFTSWIPIGPENHKDKEKARQKFHRVMNDVLARHAIEFALFSDSEECLILLDSEPDIEGEHIEEKCYRVWIKTKEQ